MPCFYLNVLLYFQQCLFLEKDESICGKSCFYGDFLVE